MTAWVPWRSGAYAPSLIFIVMSASPSSVRSMPLTEPTGTPATWTWSPLTSWLASWNRAVTVYALPGPKSRYAAAPAATTSAATAAARAMSRERITPPGPANDPEAENWRSARGQPQARPDGGGIGGLDPDHLLAALLAPHNHHA